MYVGILFAIEETQIDIFWRGVTLTDKILLIFVKSIRLYLLGGIVLLFFGAGFVGLSAAGSLYTIHCASYKTDNQASADVKRMTQNGYAAYSAPVDIKGKGKWFRVYAGKYETKEKARLAAEEMRRKNLLSEYAIFPVTATGVTKNKEKNIDKTKEPSAKAASVIADRKTKRYHLPGMPLYAKVKKNQRVVFKSENDAIAAGYSRANDGDGQAGKEKITSNTTPVSGKKAKKSGPVLAGQPVIGEITKKAPRTTESPAPAISSGKAVQTQTGEQAYSDQEEPKTNSVLYNRALMELNEKKYEQALATLKEFVERSDTPAELGERALRHMADCHYFLGAKGNKEHLQLAVQFYKNTLLSFPDDRRDNAATYYRLARTYEYLNNSSDAGRNYEMLIDKYPRSVYVPEASFRIGMLLHKIGKYAPAVDKLIAYLLKYKGGTFAKQAYYLVGDCYYRTQQSTGAEIWFRDAQKKWPDLAGIPKDVVFDLGKHKYSQRRYDEASKVFSFYANVYDTDEKLKEVLLELANSYKAGDQVSAAINIYNIIIDKFPASNEANWSILGLASLGVERPGVRVFNALNNYHYYKAPLAAYDLLLMKDQKGEIAEVALAQKGDALRKMKQDRKAAEIYSEFLKLYPQSKLAADVRKNLKVASGTLIDENYAKKDYVAVADIYFKAYTAVPLVAGEYETVNKIADSLSKIGLADDCAELLKAYKKVCPDDKIAVKLKLAIAEAQIAGEKYEDAEKNIAELLSLPAVKKNSALLLQVRKNMAEIAFRKKSYDKAVADFNAVVKYPQNINDPGPVFLRYASSLKAKKEDSLALQNYLIAVKYLDKEKQPQEGLASVYTETGDLYLKASSFKNSVSMYNKALIQSPDQDLKNWSLFGIGQAYQKMENNAEAQKTFNQIKAQAGPEGFWTKVVDYYVSDQRWWYKYEDILRN